MMRRRMLASDIGRADSLVRAYRCASPRPARYRFLGGARKLRGLGQVDLHQARHARLAHGHAAELRRRFHGALVVRDHDELHLARHLLHHLAEAPDVGLVERRVHLVEQAERRRVQPEDRRYERHGRQRLLAAREQRDVRDALARRARHDRDAGVEQVVADKLEVGVAAAEQAREELADARVDAIERLLEARARLAVDLLDRALERIQRLGQVLVLRVEVVLALGLLAEFLDRGQVHGLEPPHLLAQVLELRLPGRRVGAFGQLGLQRLGREPERGDVLDQGLGAQARALLAQARGAQRLVLGGELGFDAVALYVQLPQCQVGGVERGTGLDQRLVDEQALLDVGRALSLEARHGLAAGLELLRDLAAARRQRGALGLQALQSLSQRDERRALGFQFDLEPVHGGLGLARLHARFLATLQELPALGVERAAALFELRHARDRLLEARARLARLAVDLAQPRFELGTLLGDAGDAGRERLHPALLALNLAGELGQAPLAHVEIALCVVARGFGREQVVLALRKIVAGARDPRHEIVALGRERMKLALARQHAELRLVAAHDAHPARTEPFAARRDHGFPRREARGDGARLVQRLGDAHAREQADQRSGPAHLRRQRARRTGRAGLVRVEREVGVVDAREFAGVRVRIVDHGAVEQAAQHGLDRTLPAVGHFQHLAGATRAAKPERLEPVLRDAALLSERRVLQRLEGREPAAHRLELATKARQSGLDRASRGLGLLEGLLPRRVLRAEPLQVLLVPGQRAGAVLRLGRCALGLRTASLLAELLQAPRR